MRIARNPEALAGAWGAGSEATAAFGAAIYVGELLADAPRRDPVAATAPAIGARLARLQPATPPALVEIAPAPTLPAALVDRLATAAVRMAAETRYEGLGTFEFLVGPDGRAAFLEANPRLQVEHTVTEAVTGLDLVGIQLALAAGRSLADVGLRPDAPPPIRGVALEARVNMGRWRPTAECGRRAARSRPSRCRPGPESASTRVATPGTGRARASTRCWRR
jgi:pyruvate carboxylase